MRQSTGDLKLGMGVFSHMTYAQVHVSPVQPSLGEKQLRYQIKSEQYFSWLLPVIFCLASRRTALQPLHSVQCFLDEYLCSSLETPGLFRLCVRSKDIQFLDVNPKICSLNVKSCSTLHLGFYISFQIWPEATLRSEQWSYSAARQMASQSFATWCMRNLLKHLKWLSVMWKQGNNFINTIPHP